MPGGQVGASGQFAGMHWHASACFYEPQHHAHGHHEHHAHGHHEHHDYRHAHHHDHHDCGKISYIDYLFCITANSILLFF